MNNDAFEFTYDESFEYDEAFEAAYDNEFNEMRNTVVPQHTEVHQAMKAYLGNNPSFIGITVNQYWHALPIMFKSRGVKVSTTSFETDDTFMFEDSYFDGRNSFLSYLENGINEYEMQLTRLPRDHWAYKEPAARQHNYIQIFNLVVITIKLDKYMDGFDAAIRRKLA